MSNVIGIIIILGLAAFVGYMIYGIVRDLLKKRKKRKDK